MTNDDTEKSFESERAGTADVPPVQARHSSAMPSTTRDTEFFPHQAPSDVQPQGVREVPEEAFHVPVDDVIEGAKDEAFSSIAIVGLNSEGEVIVAGSHGTGLVKSLLKQGIEAIDKMTEIEGDADSDTTE